MGVNSFSSQLAVNVSETSQANDQGGRPLPDTLRGRPGLSRSWLPGGQRGVNSLGAPCGARSENPDRGSGYASCRARFTWNARVSDLVFLKRLGPAPGEL